MLLHHLIEISLSYRFDRQKVEFYASVAASLQDVGLPLPPNQEEIAWLPMSLVMPAQYDEWADGLFFESMSSEFIKVRLS